MPKTNPMETPVDPPTTTESPTVNPTETPTEIPVREEWPSMEPQESLEALEARVHAQLESLEASLKDPVKPSTPAAIPLHQVNPVLRSFLGGEDGFNYTGANADPPRVVEIAAPKPSGLHPRLALLQLEAMERENGTQEPLAPRVLQEPNPPVAEVPGGIPGRPSSDHTPSTEDPVDQWTARIQEYYQSRSWIRKYRVGVAGAGAFRVSQYPAGVFEDIVDRAASLLSDESYLRMWVQFCLSWSRPWSTASMARYIGEMAISLSTALYVQEAHTEA